MSRMFGLAVDNLLSVEMVTADGHNVNADEHDTRITYPNGTHNMTGDSDLFWAIRGGGGGTWGVVTKFTFKLHPASPFINFLCEYRTHLDNGTSIAEDVLKNVFSVFMKISRHWGGYFVANYIPDPAHSFESVDLFLNHYGPWDTDTRREMDALYNYHKDWQKNCLHINFTSFLDYASTVQRLRQIIRLGKTTFGEVITLDWNRSNKDGIHIISSRVLTVSGTIFKRI